MENIENIVSDMPGKPSLLKKIKHYCFSVSLLIIVIMLVLIECAFGLAGILLARSNSDPDNYTPFLVQSGTAGVALILTALETALVIVGIRSLQSHIENEKEYAVSLENDAKFEMEDLNSVKTLERTCLKPRKQVDILEFSCHAIAELFIALSFLNAAIVIGFVGLTVTANYDDIPVSSASLFISLELAVGIVFPSFLVFSTIMGVIVTRSVTHHLVLFDNLIPGFLTFLTMESGKMWSYWVIDHTFYFQAFRHGKETDVSTDGHKRHPRIITNNLVTLCLTTIIAITFIMANSFFVSVAMIRMDYYSNCEDADFQHESNCFIQPNYTHINCTEDESIQGNIICYRFLTLGHGSDLVLAFISALFLYIACDRFLIMLFKLSGALFSIKHTRLWAVMIMGVGVVLFALTIVAMLASLIIGFNFSILQLLQLFVISCDIILAGMLLAVGKPLQKVREPDLDLQFTSFLSNQA